MLSLVCVHYEEKGNGGGGGGGGGGGMVDREVGGGNGLGISGSEVECDMKCKHTLPRLE